MSPSTIRWIDINVGQLACALLTLWRNTVGRLVGKRPAKPQKIVFIKFIEQGATVLAYSALKKAVDAVGRENVYFCVFKPNRPILDVIGIVPKENVIVLNDSGLLAFFRDSLRAMRFIRKHRIDSSIDMEFFSRASAIFAYLSGVRNRVGLHRFTSEYPYRGNLLTHRVQHNAYLHTSKAYLLLVEALLEGPGDVPLLKKMPSELPVEVPNYHAKPEALAAFKQKLAEEAGRALPEQIVLLNPNASDMLPLRKWETDRFIDLGKRLKKELPEALLVVTGAPSEAGPAAKIALEMGQGVVCMAGKTSLDELFLLYELASLLVTNDSGPAHFASMTNTRILVLFGPETPQLFAPLGERIDIIWKGLACSPCVNAFNHRFSPCTDNVCMQAITVDEVEQMVLELISAHKVG